MPGLHSRDLPAPSIAQPLISEVRIQGMDGAPSRATDRVSLPSNQTIVSIIIVEDDPKARTAGRLRWLRFYEPLKYTSDFLFGLALFVLFLPVILISAMAVRLTSAGPAFYTQTRVGKNGRLFRIYKLRTMYHDCEKISGARWSVPGDPRITPLGAFLRKTHLDELPQLLNVLKGEMSLVGPRPERPEIIQTLETKIPRYRERLAIRPGVTGLAQLRLPADTTIESVREKIAYDLHYIEQAGPWLDVRLVACTLLKMCKLPLTMTLSLLGVPGERAVYNTRETFIPHAS
jgi:lipopolysaccharide/colanic/teichoic acid biosynthesis glycosyltransferase